MRELLSISKASHLIDTGHRLLVAGCEHALAKLPRGNWIGGTTAYFMTSSGGTIDRERLHVTELGLPIASSFTRTYDVNALASLPEHYPERGCSFIIIPGGSAVHFAFARNGAAASGLLNAPLVGWVAGSHLEDLKTAAPRVFDGSTGESWVDRAVVLHATIPADYVAKVEILNPFTQGSGDTLTFPESGFEVRDCFVNGTRRNFSEYVLGTPMDTRLPLVASYAGANINVSFQNVDPAKGTVRFYAPVFEDVEYKAAAPLEDYVAEFARQLALHQETPAFSCNCILNFLYGKLEGRDTGEMVGPITFGEIAYMLLNQTLTYVSFEMRTTSE